MRVRLVMVAAFALAWLAHGTEQNQPAAEEAPSMRRTEHQFFATSLGEVHFVDSGPRADVPVVLLHQTPRSIDEYREVIPILAASYRTVAIDNPGYGCSEKPPRQPTVEEYADVVVALLDHIGVAKAHLVGHHTGAILAIDVAARAPERVASLVLSGPPYMNAEMREMLHRISVQWRVQEDGSHMLEKWEKFFSWTPDPAVVHRVVTDLLRAGKTSEYGHFACADYRMEDTLPLVKAPALVIIGSNDFFAKDPQNAVITETLPNAESVEIEGGVFLPTESPEPFAHAVLSFLKSL